MAERRNSPTFDAPEAVQPQTRSAFGFVGSDDYEYYEPPPSGFDNRQRSPVPEYSAYETHSSRISAASPPLGSSEIGRSPQISDGRSPQLSDGGFSKSRPLSPSAQYSEIHSPDPQIAYDTQGEKEAVYTPHHSKVPSYHATPTPGIFHQGSGNGPQVWDQGHDQRTHQREQETKRPVYRRWWFIAGIIFIIVAIAVAVPVGVVVGGKKNNNGSNSGSGSGGSGGSGTTGDPDTAVGGNLNAAYYSKTGAFNGSGIAIAAANTQYNQAIYSFWQDYTGTLQYSLADATGKWNQIGPVNAGSYQALNGTPLSAVQHALGNVIKWHLFYIDKDYTIRERIISNTSTTGPSPVWSDGPISSQNLKTWKSTTIGLQACYFGNYYGQWSYNNTQATAGIHLWYASDATVFQQYSWTNGTDKFVFDQQWNDLSGNGGVGCQTWNTGMTEYVWFVNTHNGINMYWRDNNQSNPSTSTHPTRSWEPVDLGIQNVQKSSSLGYTNYMVWQGQDTSINGAALNFAAENTTRNMTDTFQLKANDKIVEALRGTHLSITAVSTGSGGALLELFFQDSGNDMVQYNKDAFTPNALFSLAPSQPVSPAN